MDALMSIFSKFGQVLMNVLPHSPFQQYISSFRDMPYMSYLNWFIPVGDIITVCTAWLVAIGVFYLYSIIMRWVKMIGD